jgi:catechol 2,3-dioxygenase-like lactoylglutathione lyase family enzyme
MIILGIDNVLFAVGDLDAAIALYRDGLGLPLRFALPERGIALFAIGDEAPGLLVRAGSPTDGGGSPRPSAPRLWLEVPDARASAGELRARGLAPLAPPFETATGWTVEIADPWGNVVGLADYLHRPELGRPSSA